MTASPSLAELGRRAGASERTLSRLFGDKLGMGCTAWRTQLRLHRAVLLLAQRLRQRVQGRLRTDSRVVAQIASRPRTTTIPLPRATPDEVRRCGKSGPRRPSEPEFRGTIPFVYEASII